MPKDCWTLAGLVTGPPSPAINDGAALVVGDGAELLEGSFDGVNDNVRLGDTDMEGLVDGNMDNDGM